MKVLLVLSWLVVVSGCSSPTVHLYAKYLNEQEQHEMTALLQQSNLKVEVNHHSFPKSISHTALIYSPFVSKPEEIGKIEVLMAKHNWPVARVSALVEGTHWFQKDSIGLFLVPQGVNPQDGKSMVDLAHRYSSVDCEEPVDLTLLANGEYQFSVDIGDDNYRLGRLGHWRVRTYPYIEMKPLNQTRWLYFEAEQNIITDKVSQVNVYTLTTVESYKGLGDCQFSYGERL